MRGPWVTGLALVYFATADADRGFELLRRAVDERSGPVRFAMVDPSYDAVRQDPRFQAIVARLSFPPSVTTPRR